MNSRRRNTTILAFLGDAVYELFVRSYLIDGKFHSAHEMSRMTVRFVSAKGQAFAVSVMIRSGFLAEEEIRLVKRGRNHTNTARPRGASPAEYKLATGFEALVGFLYLDGQKRRLNEVMAEAVRITEEKV